MPTIVRWPGVVAPGTTIDRTVSNLDWFPTFLGMAGVAMPDGALVRGRSMVPLLAGEMPDDWEDELFLIYSTLHQSRSHMRGWRSPAHKLIRDFLNEGRDEFYDLVADPEETTNLIDQLSEAQQAIVADFDAKIRARMEEIGDWALE